MSKKTLKLQNSWRCEGKFLLKMTSTLLMASNNLIKFEFIEWHTLEKWLKWLKWTFEQRTFHPQNNKESQDKKGTSQFVVLLYYDEYQL